MEFLRALLLDYFHSVISPIIISLLLVGWTQYLHCKYTMQYIIAVKILLNYSITGKTFWWVGDQTRWWRTTSAREFRVLQFSFSVNVSCLLLGCSFAALKIKNLPGCLPSWVSPGKLLADVPHAVKPTDPIFYKDLMNVGCCWDDKNPTLSSFRTPLNVPRVVAWSCVISFLTFNA